MSEKGLRLGEIESQLKGKTLLVYWYMLKSGGVVGVREVQRALRLSSPSVAAHHLDKLLRLGLVDKDGRGNYILKEEVKVGLLRFFVRLGKFLLPRYVFYATFVSALLISHIALNGLDATVQSLFALTIGSVSATIMWLETFRLWRHKPF